MSEAGLDRSDTVASLIEVTLIGDLGLGDPATGRKLLLSRKARALLAYLILVPVPNVSRDRLATLLWGDRGDEQARGSLRQALTELRMLSSHETSPFRISRSAVNLDRERFRTDVDAIRSAGERCDAGTLTALLGHPANTLLSDLDAVSPTFDDWLLNEREQWRHQWRAYSVAAARQALHDKKPDAAEPLARTLITDDPLDERTAWLAMEIAHAKGDRAGIHRIFQRLEEALRHDLNISPDPATFAMRDRLLTTPTPDRTKGASLDVPDAAISASPADPLDTAENDIVATIPLLRHFSGARKRLVLIASVGIVLVIALASIGWWRSGGAHRQSILVEPLQVSANDVTAQALSEGLSNGLSRVMVGTGTQIDILDPGDKAAGKAAYIVLGGNAVTSNGRAYVTVHLSSGHPATKIWSRSFSRASSDVDPLGRQIALSIGRELYFGLGNGNDQFLSADPDLMRTYLAGYDWVGKNFDEAARYFAQVVATRPDFAHGWSAYAAAVAWAAAPLPDGARQTADATAVHAARRALAIDQHQGLAYYAMAITQQGNPNWLKRNALVQRGLDVDPMQPELNAMRGTSLMTIGRYQESIGYFRKAYAADHFLPGKPVDLANALAETGDLVDAQDLIQQGYELWPDVLWFKRLDEEIAFHWGSPERALALLEESGRSPNDIAAARVFLQWRAHPTSATREAALATVTAEIGRSGATTELVQELAVLGRIDEAYRAAETLPPNQGWHDNWFHDYLAPFRADRRFIALAARLGLVSIWLKTGLWPDYCSNEKLTYDCRAEARRVNAP